MGNAKKFTEIGQYRQVIRAVKSRHDYIGKDDHGDAIYRHDGTPYPTLVFKGTPKLHGTNSSIAMYKDSRVDYQSRERVLAFGDDNAGFYAYMKNSSVLSLFKDIEFNDHCVIYGEWCGQGIQKGVAISGLPKMFVIFAVKIDDLYQPMEKYAHLKIEDENIYNIEQFPSWSIEIDFNHPEIAQNKLQELTLEVEKECPVGKHFGESGTGEGIVWEHFLEDGTRYTFKVKGEKHQNSKVKTLTTVDIEEVKNINQFIEYAVTENRMAQGIDKMKELGYEFDMKNTGIYIKWVHADVLKEEEDTMIENGINAKKIGAPLSKKARDYWFRYLDSIV